MAKRLKSRSKCPNGHFIPIGKITFCGACRAKTRYLIDAEFKAKSLANANRYRETHREQVNAAARKRHQEMKKKYQPSGFERWR